MAKSNKVLSIDITNESITIIEITASQKKQTNVHNVIIMETPEDSFEDGVIKDLDKIARAIKDQLAARMITNKNAILILSSTKIVNREVLIPFVNENKIRGIINANASEYFPVNIEDYVVSHSVLETVVEGGNKQLRVLAVAAPSQMVKTYYDLGSAAGLNVNDLDYIGNSMLQLIKTQTSANTTTMVIQLGSESTVLNIVQGDNLLLQRTVPYGTNAVVNAVMDEKNVDATTAMTLLQNDRLITVDFDDNEATGAFRYLINNIGRVMDYYSTKNPDKPIDDVFLTGDGALIRGIDGLFKIQLNVSTRIMDSLYNIKFDPTIDQKVYSPVYLIAPIGAAFNPMGFLLHDRVKKAAAGGGGMAPFVVTFIVAAAGAAALVFYPMYQKTEVQKDIDYYQAEIEKIIDIEDIILVHDAALAELNDAKSMTSMTYSLNENAREFIAQLESKIPKSVYLSNFNSSPDSVNIPGVATDYDSIAQFIINLKEISVVEDAFISNYTKVKDESGNISYTFTASCKFKLPVSDSAEETTEATDTQE